MKRSFTRPGGKRGALGAKVEDAASQWLVRGGLTILERNFRCRFGELDIIARDGDILVFVEVRFRTSPGFVSPEESIDHRKQRKLVSTAGVFLSRRRRYRELPCRFDVVVASPSDEGYAFTWHRQAFY